MKTLDGPLNLNNFIFNFHSKDRKSTVENDQNKTVNKKL